MIIYSTAGIESEKSILRTRDWTDFRHTSGSVQVETWYPAGVGNATALGAAGNATANLLYAIPFISAARGGTLNAIGWNCLGLVAASNAKMAVYGTASGSLYPGPLLYSGANISTATATTKTYTGLSISLLPDTVYWLAYVQSSTQTNRTITSAGWELILGFDGVAATTAYTMGYSVAMTYANAFPDPFTIASPNRLLGTSTIIPALFMRFGA